MNYESPFRLTRDEYHRDIDVEDAYFEQVAYYIYASNDRKYSLDFCLGVVKEMFSEEGELAQQFPVCKMWVRDQKTGDRVEKYAPINKVFRTVIDKDLISAPSWTFYLPEHVKRSKLSEFTAENVHKRALVKAEMFAADAAGDIVTKTNKKNEQNAVKTINNGMSGAFSSPYTVLFNQSSHSALTGSCRTAASLGNSSNERMIGGNRHYDTPSRIIDHFLSIATLTDFAGFKKCVETYNLHIPTVEETLDVIHYSADFYWRSEAGNEYVREFVAKQSDLVRAAFVYMGDLYHLAKYNDEFMRKFITDLISDKVYDENVEDWEAAEKTIDGDMKIIVSQFRGDIVPLGKSFSDVKIRDEDTKKALPWDQQHDYKELIRTALYLQQTIGGYTLFIKNILTTKNLPINVARMPNVIRRVGVVSDTDSTMMAVMRWAMWYCGKYHGKIATRVCDMIIYIATQHLRHLMASMSANMGVAKERYFLYAMKNEFKFDAFALTTKAKHYFSIITGQEGQLKSDPELEVKGVSLRTSNIPPVIMKEFKRTIRELCLTIGRGELIEIVPVLEKVAAIEHTIVDSLMAGKAGYLKSTNIKERTAYSDDDEKSYHYHRMYNAIFGPKYGYIDEPPYDAVKLPVRLENKTAIKEWLDSIEDDIIRNGAKAWFESTNYRKYKTLILPGFLVENYGIPPDLVRIADVRRTAFATVEPYYHILECFGVFMIDKNRTRLLSDYYGEGLEVDIDLGDGSYVKPDEITDEDDDEDEEDEE